MLEVPNKNISISEADEHASRIDVLLTIVEKTFFLFFCFLKAPVSLKSVSHISYIDETWHTLPKEDRKNT